MRLFQFRAFIIKMNTHSNEIAFIRLYEHCERTAFIFRHKHSFYFYVLRVIFEYYFTVTYLQISIHPISFMLVFVLSIHYPTNKQLQ